jgi:hypothetical protein
MASSIRAAKALADHPKSKECAKPSNFDARPPLPAASSGTKATCGDIYLLIGLRAIIDFRRCNAKGPSKQLGPMH